MLVVTISAVVLIVAAAALFLNGVVLPWLQEGGLITTGANVSATNTPVVVKYANVKIYDPTYIAYQLGYFGEENITLQFVGEVISGPQSIAAISAGTAQAGVAAIPAIINARYAGANITGVLDIQTAFNDSPLAEWYTLNNSGITDASSLRGKKMGINSLGASFYYTSLLYLARHNMTPADVTFVVVPHPNLEESLRSGQVDVAGMIDPYTKHAASAGGVRVLFNQYDVTGQNQFTLVILSSKFAAQNPGVAMRFSAAYIKAVKFIEANPTESAAIIANWTGLNLTYVQSHRFMPNATVDGNSIRYWLSAMSTYAGSNYTSLNVSGIGTNAYNPYVESAT